MKAKCIITNCQKSAPSGEAFCAEHRRGSLERTAETPSPDIMEVWRDAVYAYGGQSIEGGESEDYAARVIAEAKARWEREAFEKAAQVAEVDADHSNALFTAAAGGDEGKDRNAARYRTALRIARNIRAIKEPKP